MTQQEHIDLFQEMLNTSEEKRCAMINSGMFNSIIQGYLVVTLKELGYSEEQIDEAAARLQYGIFDTVTADEAKKQAIY